MSRMVLVTWLGSILMVAGLSRDARAGEFAYAPGKVTATVPNDWKTVTAGDGKGGLLMSVNPDKSALVFVTITDAKDAAQAEAALDKLLAPVLVKVKRSKPKPVDLNGMKGVGLDGKARTKDGDKKVGFLVLLVETPAKKVVLFVGLADDAKFAANKDQLVGIVQSIKPMP